MTNFWKDLKKTIYTLAPMEDVTDTAFREVIASISDPDMLHVVFAEFTSTDGFMHPQGHSRVKHRLYISETEKEELKKKNIKIVAQIWGNNPEKYAQTAKIINEEMDFDGIDINFGCPVKKIVKNGCCSALIDNPTLAQEIILATKEASNIPVSVKTRTGVREHRTEEWMEELMATKPAAIILHARTQKMMSEKPAEWNELKKAAKVIKNIDPELPFLGNGDVFTMEDAKRMMDEFDTDGVMIGRGIFKEPWFFKKEKYNPSPTEKLSLLWKHTKLYSETWRSTDSSHIKNFNLMKRFFKIYTYDFPRAAEIRADLMLTEKIEDVKKILDNCGYEVDYSGGVL